MIPAPYGRPVSYLRLSVTDRCDQRCTYCMAEKMTFLPKRDVLSLEELARLTDLFIRHGIRKLRHADTLAACGVRRVNVSLDTLDAGRYRNLTRLGDIKVTPSCERYSYIQSAPKGNDRGA